MNDEPVQVKIKILEKEYLIACQPSQEEDLRTSARLLDQRMREIHKHGRVIGTDRIAVMAALNIAHEFIQLQRIRPTLDEDSAERLQRLQMQITTALAPELLPITAEITPVDADLATTVTTLDAPDERV
ncbi:cell division protein ZapA [Chromatium okenii]|uniref:cell division protein ZapA n=1 Tax=Chromatium okenii TaxID=61644 RepID=UPI0026E99901|nr:cell division protein ZapA [Chromatium okenii]MBV5308051.1 cell division protein ZapA [Chromatium okenii]